MSIIDPSTAPHMKFGHPSNNIACASAPICGVDQIAGFGANRGRRQIAYQDDTLSNIRVRSTYLTFAEPEYLQNSCKSIWGLVMMESNLISHICGAQCLSSEHSLLNFITICTQATTTWFCATFVVAQTVNASREHLELNVIRVDTVAIYWLSKHTYDLWPMNMRTGVIINQVRLSYVAYSILAPTKIDTRTICKLQNEYLSWADLPRIAQHSVTS